MLKFDKHGSSVVIAVVKLARGYTGRKIVTIPAQQLFFHFMFGLSAVRF